MKLLLNELAKHAMMIPERIAIENASLRLSYFSLNNEINKLAQDLECKQVKRVALLMDNSPLWVIADLACLKVGITLVPLPTFFTVQQMQHAIQDAAVQILLTDDKEFFQKHLPQYKISASKNVIGKGLWCVEINDKQSDNLENIAKITYTSGTTGSPKGVCLTQDTMCNTAMALANAVQVTRQDRHLCLLPLGVLLENIAGVYVPLLAGACCILPNLRDVGMLGATTFDVNKMLTAIEKYQASTVILLPQMLQACVKTIADGVQLSSSLRFIAVGGAHVSPTLLANAIALRMPVYEGYGLSECGSVVALNTLGENKPGSVGKLLPHMRITINNDGEILFSGNLYSGYLNQDRFNEEWYASGDLGYLDQEGYLFLTGRKKNCFITSFGRNVAPEWIECELILAPIIDQAVVFGEARPFNVAVIVASSSRSDDEIDGVIAAVNRSLPDYAQVRKWVRAIEPFSLANDQMTATGRVRRKIIWQNYQRMINHFYS